MAALYGRMSGARGEVTRTGTPGSGIQAKLETWEGSVKVELQADGSFEVWMGDKSNPRIMVAQGNVNTREAWATDLAFGLPTLVQSDEPLNYVR
jgi:hypothetical protein